MQRAVRRRVASKPIVTLAALAVVIAAAGLAGASGAPGSPPTMPPAPQKHRPWTSRPSPVTPPSAGSVASAATEPSIGLPATSSYTQISVTPGGQLLLFGGTTAGAGSGAPACVSTDVDPETFVLGTPVVGSCDDPALFGETVEMLTTTGVEDSGDEVNVTIGRVDPSSGQVTVSPVVMTYQDCSDCRPVTADGGGSLWIYDNSTTAGAELLEVSDTSGEVLDTIAMPQLDRPLLAGYGDGVVVANSLHQGLFAGESPPAAVYYVAAGAERPSVLVADTSLIACWLTADADHLWIGMGSTFTGCTRGSIWRLDGLDPRPAFEVPATGEVPWVVLGDETAGLWTVEWPGQPMPRWAPTQVVAIDPDSGRQSVVATLPPQEVNTSYDTIVPGEAVLLDGWLYVLEPPVRPGGGYASLVRIAL